MDDRFLVIDLKRHSPLGLFVAPIAVVLLAAVAVVARPLFRRVMHGGFIGMLRAYSRSALDAFGKTADAQMHCEYIATAR